MRTTRQRPAIRVLMVDDDEDIRVGVAAVLSDYDVTCAVDAFDALGRLRAARFDVMVTDVSMPGLSGPALRERVAQIDEGLAARTLFVTGDASHRELRDALASRPGLVLPKPIDVLRLRGLVARLAEGAWTLGAPAPSGPARSDDAAFRGSPGPA